jgi:ATP phosphoribosyltransferase regulatory subunit
MTHETNVPSPLAGRSQIPHGVQDRFLGEAARRRQAEATLRECFSRWAYDEIIPPTFEYYDNLSVGAGPRLRQAMYRFLDPQGRTLALRADFTPQVARIAATKLFDRPMPLRCFYAGSLFRHEEPHAGRQREFSQAGVELIGADTAGADAEVVALGIAALEALDLAGFQINLGQMAFFRAVTEDLPRAVVDAVREAVDRKSGVQLDAALAGVPAPRRRLLRRLPDLVGGREVLDQARDLCHDLQQPRAPEAALGRLAQVHEQLEAYGVSGHVILDLGEVRGMDYYTGITFRGLVPGLGWPVLSGGRYDDLIANFGRSLAAVGFGLSIGRALLARDAGGARRQPPASLGAHLLVHACARPRCLALVAALRRQGCRVEVDVVGVGEAALAAEASRRGIQHTLRCTGSPEGDTWLLASASTGPDAAGPGRELAAAQVLAEAQALCQDEGDAL